MTEAELQKATLDLARLLNWRIARFPMLNLTADRKPRRLAYDTKGYPDATLVRDRLILVEFKAANQDLSDEQRDWHRWLLKAGVVKHTWWPADWSDGTIERALRRTTGAKASA